MPQGRRAAAFLLLLVATLLAVFAAASTGAELRLRESLLQAQRDRISIAITAVVDHIGVEAHDLAEDCDIHVPLRSRAIGVPVLGEVKNACSIPPGVPRSHWSNLIYQETHGLAVPVEGVFRIWLEHPPSGTAIQTEAERVPWYPHSNPDHQVELHPLTQVGSLDFRSHVGRIENETEFFEGFGVPDLQTVLGRKITIQRLTTGGQSFVRIKGTKTGFNHWQLRARVLAAPEALTDGLRIRLDILSAAGTQVVPGALNIPAVALTGTAAHGKTQSLTLGSIIRFHALVRMRLGTVLDEVGATAKEIPLPIEFVLLDVD